MQPITLDIDLYTNRGQDSISTSIFKLEKAFREQAKQEGWTDDEVNGVGGLQNTVGFLS